MHTYPDCLIVTIAEASAPLTVITSETLSLSPSPSDPSRSSPSRPPQLPLIVRRQPSRDATRVDGHHHILVDHRFHARVYPLGYGTASELITTIRPESPESNRSLAGTQSDSAAVSKTNLKLTAFTLDEFIAPNRAEPVGVDCHCPIRTNPRHSIRIDRHHPMRVDPCNLIRFPFHCHGHILIHSGNECRCCPHLESQPTQFTVGARAVTAITVTDKATAIAIKEVPQKPIFHNSA
jgi:hypothetical protein